MSALSILIPVSGVQLSGIIHYIADAQIVCITRSRSLLQQ
ncbi:hypothetical protein FDUTEX481_00189 [Tolypothrix sp. PCC 7601]|nr:hypothetical protein FDUTEX481_00189 [Tolypothrix sp. PCC 7601]